MASIQNVKRIRLAGDALMLGLLFLLSYTFIRAYFSGDYRATIDINHYGEAHIELILLIVILILGAATVVYSFMDWKSTWRAPEMVRYNDYYFQAVEAGAKTEPAAPERMSFRCPGCGGGFAVRVKDATAGTFNCPFCGVEGMIDASAPRTAPEAAPSVSVIKDVRR